MTGRTLGIAIEVPAPLGERIDEARRGYEPGHHRMPAHITLIPPFDADEDAVLVIRQHLAAVAAAHAPFTIGIDGVGSFLPTTPVVFAEVGQGAAECAALAAALRTGPLAIESRFAYHPHVTLAHTEDEAVLARAQADFADVAARFTVGAFRLYEHRPQAWVPIGEHMLAGRG